MSAPTVDLPIIDGPKWISHIEISRDPEYGGQLCLRIVKESGADYGCVLIDDDKLKQIMAFV